MGVGQDGGPTENTFWKSIRKKSFFIQNFWVKRQKKKHLEFFCHFLESDRQKMIFLAFSIVSEYALFIYFFACFPETAGKNIFDFYSNISFKKYFISFNWST